MWWCAPDIRAVAKQNDVNHDAVELRDVAASNALIAQPSLHHMTKSNDLCVPAHDLRGVCTSSLIQSQAECFMVQRWHLLAHGHNNITTDAISVHLPRILIAA